MDSRNDLLASLRERTRPLHDAVESLTGGERFLTGEFDPDHYCHFLLTHYLYHLEVARQVAAWPSLEGNVLDWPDSSRIDGLRDDLDRLGLREATLQTLAPITLPLRSPGYALGLCYVSEGSVLGSKRMYEGLRANSHFNQIRADRFFRIGKEGMGGRWKTFLEILLDEAENHRDEVEEGAVAGFELFGRIWERLGLCSFRDFQDGGREATPLVT